MNNPYISVGYHKGEMDFSISAEVQDLDHSEMNDLRQMIVVAIGTMEDMWRREQADNFIDKKIGRHKK